jgi:hypothetical protein
MRLKLEPKKNNKLKIFRYKKLGSLFEKLIDLREGTDSKFGYYKGVIYRGQSDASWPLQSKLERKKLKGIYPDINHDRKPYEKLCKSILEKFKDYYNQLPDKKSDIIKDEEFWALGAHYGLSTPYLDWSTSPLIALYFATLDYYKSFEYNHELDLRKIYDSRAALWRLKMKDNSLNEDFEIFDIKSQNGSRVNAQKGVLTYLKTVEYDDIESYLKSKGKLHFLEKIEISGKLIAELLQFFDVIGMNYFSIYPDLVGAVTQSGIFDESIMNNCEFIKINLKSKGKKKKV